jgi:hypothetical protein
MMDYTDDDGVVHTEARTIKMPCYNMVITTVDRAGDTSGSIISDLTVKRPRGSALSEPEVYYGLQAIESMVLAHACAGVDVESHAYIEGLETAVDAVLNNEG